MNQQILDDQAEEIKKLQRERAKLAGVFINFFKTYFLSLMKKTFHGHFFIISL
jgi:hypothetical protein